MGTNAQSKLHSWLHHRFLLSISCMQHKETDPTFNYIALNLPSKVGILRLNSDGNENLHVGTFVCKELFGSRWVRDMEWLMAEHRVLPILLSTLIAWFKLCFALVQLSTHLQCGCKRTLVFCGSIQCKGLALKAQ